MDLDEKKDIVAKKVFHIEVLPLLKENQQQHGLRHGDYQRYRQYISRKLHRIRKSLHFPQGTRSKVVPKKITPELLTDSRYLHLKLFEAERSWAYAMQLKTEANTEPRKNFHKMSRLRKAVSRAEELADLVQLVGSGSASVACDARTKLETQAYSKWMRGLLCFEQEEWDKAKELLEAARAIYTGLSETVEEEDERALYVGRTDELLPQIRYCAYNIGDETAAGDLRTMRAHAASDSNAIHLDQLLGQARTAQAGSVTEVTWLDHVIPIKLEKARMAILAARDAELELAEANDSQSKLSVYESVLKSCVDAISAVREDARSAAAAVAAGASAAGSSSAEGAASAAAAGLAALKVTGVPLDKMTRLQLLHTYLHYLKLSNTVERNLVLIESANARQQQKSQADLATGSSDVGPAGTAGTGTGPAKPQEVARLYDTVVQVCQELAGLPGLVDDDTGLRDELDAKISAYRAFRCYYLAQTYYQGKKYAECSALLKRTQEHIRQATDHLALVTTDKKPGQKHDESGAGGRSVVPGPCPSVLHRELEVLLQRAGADELACRAGRMLVLTLPDTADAGTEDKGLEGLLKLPLFQRLDTYLEDRSLLSRKGSAGSSGSGSQPLIRSPPDFQPIPAKPVFFDLALNHIEFPSLDDKLGRRSGPSGAASAAGGGLTGFVKGWLWGGGGKADGAKK